MDGVVNGLVIAALELSDRDHHIQFAHAQPRQRSRLLPQRRHQRRTKRKANDHANRNPRAGEQVNSGRGPHRIHHGAGKPVANRLVAQVLDLCSRRLRLEQRVVDDCGERPPAGKSFRGECRGIERAVIEFQLGNIDRSD